MSISILFSEQLPQAFQTAFPRGAVIMNPLFEKREPGRLDAAGAHAAKLFRVNKMAFFKNLQMLDNCRQGDAQWLSKPGNGSRTLGEPVENGAASRVAQGMKEAVDGEVGVLHHLALAGQLGGEPIEQIAPATLAHFGAVGALVKRALIGEYEIRSLRVGQKLDRDQRGGDAMVAEAHG